MEGVWRHEGPTFLREGGFFLIARGDTEQVGQRTNDVEIIGYDHEAGGAPSDIMTSRLYADRGDTLNYTHEVDDKGVTTWLGAKGSRSSFKARWIDDNTLADLVPNRAISSGSFGPT